MAVKILVVDDEEELLVGLCAMLSGEFPQIDILSSANSVEALNIVERQDINIVLTDIRMPEMDGLELLLKIKKFDPVVTVLIMTAFGSVEMAVEAVKQGAYDFLCKPFDYKNLCRSIRRAIDHNRLIRENISLKRRISDRVVFENFVGQSAPMQKFYDNIRAVARTNYTVLVRGESGTGKELTAKAIHRHSDRRDGSLVIVNCPAIPENLLESELFGHKKGAFTGANYDHNGLFAEADGGTICLDEIGDMAMSVQVKLLRVLQEGEIRPLGASANSKVDARVIAMTNQDIEKKISDGQFREDLFYRLNVVTVRTPELAEIREDIPLLISHFVKLACTEQGIDLKKVDPQLIKIMTERAWPGNVRQLQNEIRRAVVFCGGDMIGLENMDLAADMTNSPQSISRIQEYCLDTSYKSGKEKVLREFSVAYIGRLLKITNGNVSRAAALAGLSRAALQKIINRFEINIAGYRNGYST